MKCNTDIIYLNACSRKSFLLLEPVLLCFTISIILPKARKNECNVECKG